MTRALALKQKQVTAICRGAAKAGFVAEVKIGDVVVRLIPANDPQAKPDVDDPESFDTFEQYAAWRDKAGVGEA